MRKDSSQQESLANRTLFNMELGMLVRGGTMQSRVEQQFGCLLQSGRLKQV